MKRISISSCLALAMSILCVTGCVEEPVAVGTPGPGPAADSPAEVYNHPTEGPHHGALIELGAEEYHGELIHDEESGNVTIYLLDSTARRPVAADEPHVTINLRQDGQGQQFRLPASPDSDDTEGMSSRFAATDRDLGAQLHLDNVKATLVVAIGGKSYRGEIVHHHGHADHDHDHNHKH